MSLWRCELIQTIALSLLALGLVLLADPESPVDYPLVESSYVQIGIDARVEANS
jgi:hypothetical protein